MKSVEKAFALWMKGLNQTLGSVLSMNFGIRV